MSNIISRVEALEGIFNEKVAKEATENASLKSIENRLERLEEIIEKLGFYIP